MGSNNENGSNHDIDLGPWVDPPPEDQSPHADFRREVASLAREVLASVASGGRQRADHGADQPPAYPDSDPDPDPDRQTDREPTPLSPGHFDLRATAPYQLARTYRALAHGVTAGRRGTRGGSAGTVLVRDLMLMEVARRHPTTPTELGRRLRIPASTLSAVIDSSVRGGLVQRGRHPGDARRWLIDPTPAGLQRADDAVRAWRAADEAIAGVLSPIERDQLRWLLQRVGSTPFRGRPCPRGSLAPIRSL